MVEVANFEGSSTQKVRVGTRIIKQLSTTFYPNPLIIFEELVVNSRDALARTVKIDVGLEKITVEDDGEGMTPDGLVHFFYISSSDKISQRVRSFRGVKREIIGKFGIGKISLYQICKEFKIASWRDGIESFAKFNFEEFEKEEFVDDFTLQVESKKTDKAGSGTIITLCKLREEAVNQIEINKIKRRLITTMPFSPDFKIILSGTGIRVPIVLEPAILEGRIKAEYPIDDPVPKVGRVTGEIVYFEKEEPTNYGVFIRVFGRLVNLDNRTGIINFSKYSHPHMFYQRIYISLQADGLNEALQTNRAGFILTHPAYEEFIKWLDKKIKFVFESEYKKWTEVRSEIETKEIPTGISEAFQTMANYDHALAEEKQRPRKTAQKEDSKASVKPQKEKADLMSLIRKGELKVEVREMGILSPEAIFEKNILVINSSNPSYTFARTHGRLPGLVYHIFKASAVLIALDSSGTLNEFKTKYDEIVRNVELLENLREIFRKKRLTD